MVMGMTCELGGITGWGIVDVVVKACNRGSPNMEPGSGAYASTIWGVDMTFVTSGVEKLAISWPGQKPYTHDV